MRIEQDQLDADTIYKGKGDIQLTKKHINTKCNVTIGCGGDESLCLHKCQVYCSYLQSVEGLSAISFLLYIL